MERHGPTMFGLAGKVWHGDASCVRAGNVIVCNGQYRFGWRGVVSYGEVGHGELRNGML